MRASAPGKLVLLGDYAVLEGATALVAAVDRRATGTREHEGRGSPVVQAVRARIPEPHSASVRIDTSGFYDGEDKLGVGSSAAVAVVAAALFSGTRDERALEAALEGHRDASGGEGSGVDVAASFYGGVIAAKRQPGPVQPLPSSIKGLDLSVLFTGHSAKTTDFVDACRRSPRFTAWVSVLTGLADEGIDAYRRQHARSFLSVVSRYGRAMAGLGADAGVPVVTEQIDAIMRLAGEAAGAAKPSGAGGGDVVVLWSADRDVAARIAEATGARHLDIAVDPRGLAVEPW